MLKEITTAFITGAGSGIGRALAHDLVNRKKVVCITDKDLAALSLVEKELKSIGGEVHAFQLDVSDKNSVFSLAQIVNEKVGPIDIIFNNAGVSLTDTVVEMEYQDFQWIMDINFWGVVHGTKAFLPFMLERGFGHIVNVSSLFGLVGVPAQAAYCASKHAVKGFNESLHYELVGTGVQIHSVHPGGVDTNIVVNGVQKHNGMGAIDLSVMQRRFKKMAVTSPEEASRIILAGVGAGKYRILVGSDAQRADRFSRWMPNRWRKVFANRMQTKGGVVF